MRRKTMATTAAMVTLLVGAAAWAMQAERPAQPQRGGPKGGGMSAEPLLRGLRATPGCLGADAGGWSSGKQTIIAWFEDKEAVLRWYHGPTHQAMMADLADADPEPPMQHVPDDAKWIMVMATITPTNGQPIEGLRMPVSQISIEMFQALPGGAAVNGRLAPDAFKVPHLKDYTPPKPADG